jgi:hypothetical protein
MPECQLWAFEVNPLAKAGYLGFIEVPVSRNTIRRQRDFEVNNGR